MPNFNDYCGLKLVWKIENFSYSKDYSVFSPLLCPPSKQWVLTIFRDDSHIFAGVHNWKVSSFNDYHCSIALLDPEGSPLICKEGTVKRLEKFEMHRHSFKFPIENKYFPGDKLRVECRIWINSNGLSAPFSQFVCTRIEPNAKVLRKNFRFNISRVKNYSENMASTFKEIIYNEHVFEVKISLPDVGQISVELFTRTLFGFRAKIQVYVVDNLGKMIEFGTCNAKLTSENHSCQFDINVSKAVLLCHSNRFLIEGKLSLVFNCMFSGNFSSDKMVEESEIFSNRPTVYVNGEFFETGADEIEVTDSNKPEAGQDNETQPPDTLAQTLEEMLSQGYLSDFNLKIGERTFPIHKNILGMRSKVFRSMFASEMKEAQDNCMDIKDVDGDTLQRMLQFVYSDKIEQNMDWEETASLFAAADFYALEPLKQGCSAILISDISTTSALCVLALADLHQDQQLKSAVLDFISLNNQGIVETEDWTKFEEANGKLALETLRKLYSKKMRR